MKGSTKKKIRRCVICVVAFIAVYTVPHMKGIAELLAWAALGLAWFPLLVWWDWPTDEEWAKHLKVLEDGGYKLRKKDEPVSRREEPKPEPLSPELAELAEKIRKKLK
jgi:hypothetical protein